MHKTPPDTASPNASATDALGALAIHIPREYNAAEYFVDRHLAEGRGAKLAYIDDHGEYSYADLAARVNRAGNALRALGIARGERVIICLLDGIDFPALFWGALKIGAIPVPLNTALTADDYGYIIRDSDAAALAVSDALAHGFEPILCGIPNLRHVLVCGAHDTPLAHHTSFERLTAQAADDLRAAPALAEDIAFWLYSSGSTGRPKGVIHRHRELAQTAALYATGVLGLNSDDIVYSASKMFFAYGLGNSMTFPLHAGATAILTAERPSPDTVMRLMSRYRPTLFFGVPTLFASILSHHVDAPGEAVSRLRLCASAGEALPASVADRWSERFGVEIIDGLGSTESLHIFLSNRPGATRRETSGKPVEGYEVSLRNEDGTEAADDEVGDLWVRGPSIAAGYWNNPEASARTFIDGWLRTGDKYVRDADGYFHYTGRADDMLKVGGIWVSPFEVESALLEHPDVLEAAVIGEEDGDTLIKPKAFVVTRNPARATPELAEVLKQFIKRRLAPYKYPRWIEFRAELPRTPTGKLRRAELRKRA